MNPKWLMLAPLPVWAFLALYLALYPSQFYANFPAFWILNDAGIVVAIAGFVLWLFSDHHAAPKPHRVLFHLRRPGGH